MIDTKDDGGPALQVLAKLVARQISDAQRAAIMLLSRDDVGPHRGEAMSWQTRQYLEDAGLIEVDGGVASGDTGSNPFWTLGLTEAGNAVLAQLLSARKGE